MPVASDYLVQLFGLEGDVADEASVQAAVERFLGEFGKVDILVDNARINIARNRTI